MRTRDWPTAFAEVRNRKVTPARPGWLVSIAYTYPVGELSAGELERRYLLRRWAEAGAERAEQTGIEVRYDPASPEHSCLPLPRR